MSAAPLQLLGIMSGSSLDGIDLAACTFDFSPEGGLRHWRVLAAETLPLPDGWPERLRALPDASAQTLALTQADFGRWLGEEARAFLRRHGVSVDAIASHGHTVFHAPEAGYSTQIGDGAVIAAVTGIDTLDNFRMQDISLGGQGAPLAPVADAYLFPEYDFLLNLGGIANISARSPRGYIAFDCTGANQVLNALARAMGREYDEGGAIAKTGHLLPGVLDEALTLPYHAAPYPKSLSNAWVREKLLPIYLRAEGEVPDKLHTACRQIARTVAMSLTSILEREQASAKSLRLMVSGGGALNAFLVDCIREECEKICSLALEIPAPEVIHYKEATLMALMGALRLRRAANVLPSATGAERAACAGAWHRGR